MISIANIRPHRYDAEEYDFVSMVGKALGAEDLARLHEGGPTYDRFDRKHDQSTPFHQRYYAFVRSDPSFGELYRRFLGGFVAPLVGEALVYQRIPNIRIHLPNNVAVGEFHCDADYGHDESEINFWLPVTRSWGTNSVWIESAPGRGDFSPWTVGPGEILQFDAVHLVHGNKENETGVTRVSIDFRVIPRSAYRPRDVRSVNAGLKFEVGDYFEILESPD
jgi:hypothetical protein